MRLLFRPLDATRWIRSVVHVIASTALFASGAAAQSRADSIAVLTAAFKVATTKNQPLFVRGDDNYRFSRYTLNELLEEAARNAQLEWVARAPAAIRDPDPKVQGILRGAVWIPYMLRFRGSVGLDSIAFVSATAVVVEYHLTTYLEPRPSRAKTEFGVMKLARGVSGAWTVRADRVSAVNEDISYFPFASPTLEPDSAGRRWHTEVRAILRAHGIVLP